MLIELQQVRRTYTMGAHQVVALDGVDVQIEHGEFVTIIGPSGSGKSTMMHLLGCLDRPSSGRYLLDGVAVETLGDVELSRLRNRKVGFIFQSFNLIPQLSVVENVELPLVYSGMPREQRRGRALQMLDAVGLAQRETHRPTELSGGECQRVAIARALVNEPPLLLADEPTGNLDTRTGTEILRVFQKLHQNGTTLILVTHDPELPKWSQRTIAMRDGRVERDTRSTQQPVPAASHHGWREQA